MVAIAPLNVGNAQAIPGVPPLEPIPGHPAPTPSQPGYQTCYPGIPNCICYPPSATTNCTVATPTPTKRSVSKAAGIAVHVQPAVPLSPQNIYSLLQCHTINSQGCDPTLFNAGCMCDQGTCLCFNVP